MYIPPRMPATTIAGSSSVNLPIEPINYSEKHISNVERMIETLKKSGIDFTSEERNVLTGTTMANYAAKGCVHDDSVCYNYGKLQRGEYAFTDLRDQTVYPVDLAKANVITEKLNNRGQKEVSFNVPTEEFYNLKITPLTSVEYEQGLPFLLSCETGHCDIIGGLGGNYPLSEYLSTDGISCKVMNGHVYIGHFNLWKTDDNKSIVIGTLALKREEVASTVFRQLLENLSVSLLKSNPDISNILIGMGGQNLNLLYPNIFTDGSEQFKALRDVRHADAVQDKFQTQLETIKETTGLDFYGGITLRNQAQIGMEPDDRKDMKNSLVFMNQSLAHDVASRSDHILNELKANSAAADAKIGRGREWREAAERGIEWRQSQFDAFKKWQGENGVEDVKLEHGQHQDVIVSSSTPFKSGHDFKVIELGEKDGKYYLKLRVGGSSSENPGRF